MTGTAVPTSVPSLPSSDSDSGGLSAGGTIAVAVVVPVVSVAVIIYLLLWWWRKHKANKLTEEERRKEVEEYGYNPNQDPTLPAVGIATSSYEDRYDSPDGSSGYRGWGTTSHPRKPSTNLSSGPGGSIPLSDTGSNSGYHRNTPSEGTAGYADGYGEGPGRPDSGEVGVIGAVGAHDPGIQRGPSNASSGYSQGDQSDLTDDGHQYYYGQDPYVDPYGDGGYDGHPPVIRDVQARRNTRIESPGVCPPPANSGIAQNF